MRQADATADISLLPTRVGGRQYPTPPDWFACPMLLPGINLDVRIRLDAPLHPGESRRVELYFLSPDLAAARIRVGTTFDLWDLRIIGSGTIRELLEIRNDAPLEPV